MIQAPPAPRTTRFGLEAEVLADSKRGGGQHVVLKVELAGRPLVIKVYGAKRDPLRDLLRDFGHRYIVGKTGMTPAARARTEREVLALWRRHGFDVPAEVAIALPPEVPPLRLVSEFVPGRVMNRWLADQTVPVEEKTAAMQRLGADWGRRHALAIQWREPRLVQAHAFFGHVLVAPPRLVHFDFEVAWARQHDVAHLVSLEITEWLRSLGGWIPPWELAPAIQAFVRGYPDAERLARVAHDARRGRMPLLSAVTRLGLWLHERGPGRKVEVLALLERALAGSGPR